MGTIVMRSKQIGYTRTVHVLDERGLVVHPNLSDDDGPVLRFNRGRGFVERELIARAGWRIVEGALTR